MVTDLVPSEVSEDSKMKKAQLEPEGLRFLRGNSNGGMEGHLRQRGCVCVKVCGIQRSVVGSSGREWVRWLWSVTKSFLGQDVRFCSVSNKEIMKAS